MIHGEQSGKARKVRHVVCVCVCVCFFLWRGRDNADRHLARKAGVVPSQSQFSLFAPVAIGNCQQGKA